MLRVAAITSGKNVPSARFRVRQHIPLLHRMGIDVRESVPLIGKYRPAPGWFGRTRSKLRLPLVALWQALKLSTRFPGIVNSWRSQITWLEREMLPGYLTLESTLRHPLAFDVDDAIWRSRPYGRTLAKFVGRRADVVIAGNAFLAEWFSQHARRVEVIPTAIDAGRFASKVRYWDGSQPFVIGWTGSSGNFPYLAMVEDSLCAFFERYAQARLLVIADAPPQFPRLRSEHVEYVKWTPANEAETVQRIDVGLMPLPDDDWTRGKCSFKMLQYMSCGIPVIVSPVGMNLDVLRMGDVGLAPTSISEWYDALEYLYKNYQHGIESGKRGRKIIEKHFNIEVVARQLAQVFLSLAP